MFTFIYVQDLAKRRLFWSSNRPSRGLHRRLSILTFCCMIVSNVFRIKITITSFQCVSSYITHEISSFCCTAKKLIKHRTIVNGLCMNLRQEENGWNNEEQRRDKTKRMENVAYYSCYFSTLPFVVNKDFHSGSHHSTGRYWNSWRKLR